MGHSVALLDDDVMSARFYASALESHGITPHLFDDVTEFLDEIEKGYDYSAFVVDAMMPSGSLHLPDCGMSTGLAVVERVRLHYQSHPILLLTNRSDHDTMLTRLDGCDIQILTKLDTTPSDLAAIVRRLI